MATNPYAVDFGNLPFQGTAASGQMFQGFGGSPQQAMAALGPNYNASYQGQLGLNIGLGNTINDLYNRIGQGQQGAQQNIAQGYGNLQSAVQGTIQGIDASQRQAIADSYAQQSGAVGQGLVSRGLGNFTVADAAQRGLSLDKQKADIALSNQTAGLSAGWLGQMGQAALSQANAANMQNTALGSQQANWLNSISATYPQAGLFAGLAQQAGAAMQSNANRGQAVDQFNKMQDASRQGVPNAGGASGVNPGFVSRSPAGLSGQGPSGAPSMGYGGIGGGQIYPGQNPVPAPGVGVGAGAYGDTSIYGVDYSAGNYKDEAAGYPGSGDAFMAATGFPSGLGGGDSYGTAGPYEDPYALGWGDDAGWGG